MEELFILMIIQFCFNIAILVDYEKKIIVKLIILIILNKI